jgi:hypothetical protein
MKGHPDYERVEDEVAEEPVKKPIGRPRKVETDTPEAE